jgi:hypothetical protein
VNLHFKKGFFQNIYSLQELLAHESVHAVRMAFDQSQFEEYLAYLTSFRNYRKWMGPFFQTTWETSSLLLFSFSLSAYLALPSLFPAVFFSSLLASSVLFSFYAIRCSRRHQIFYRCFKKLKLVLPHNRIYPFMLRLNDREIKQFGLWDQKKIYSYIEEEKKRTLRGRLLALYLRI